MNNMRDKNFAVEPHQKVFGGRCSLLMNICNVKVLALNVGDQPEAYWSLTHARSSFH